MFPYLENLNPLESSDYNESDVLFSHENSDVILSLIADLTYPDEAYLMLAVDVFGQGVKVYDLFSVDRASELHAEWEFQTEWDLILSHDWTLPA